MSDSFQPGLHLIHGNRVEDLRDLLVALLQKYPPAPLEPAVFLVQSNGIAQWLKLRLAAPEAWHIAAAVDMQMPARFLWQAYRAVLGPDTVPAESPFDKERLTWRLMRLLPGWLDEPLFAELAHFLRDDDDLRKRYQLAAELADLFDQYQVYRADWLAAWSAGRDELISPRGVREPLPESQRWQAELWRRVLADLPLDESHLSRAEMHRQFIGQVRTGTGLLPGLPRRLFVFGLSALPQQALEALHALSTRLQIYLFVHNPCRYYWADIIEERELLQPLRPSHAAKPGLAALDQVELAAAANPLLAAWGKQGRDFIGLLYQYDQASAGSQQIDLFQPFVETPGSGSLLAQLQQGILDLEPPASPPLPVDPADRSITFHLAHSRQREVEVLHDQLLAMFDEATRAGRRLEPRDVIVMVPDIDVYAPHIEAVFGNIAPQDERYIPYTVADRPTRATSPLMTAVETLLQLPDQRFAASEVLALLQVPAVRARYGIEEADLPRLQQWIGESGIRWGLDARHRERFALPPLAQNSWRFGLERMLMGYAVGDGDGWNGIEPYAEPSGQAATLVGDIAAMLEGLQRHGRLLGRDHAPAEWGTLLRELWHDFLQAESAQDQLVLDQLDAALERWLEACAAAGLADPLPLTVVREALLAGFDATGISQRFLAGSVNFCTLMPMRAIPFPVVCLLGMNVGDYPRLRAPGGFDVMAGRYRPGVRSRRV
ncbi:MAG: exodeoxyribonuclease V subunit gamma, partial [Spongiibacteraceae bacterium]|nr:exodeoxyribonuclease V subunit gamma [Spongiibacteraceae bacterium]